MKFVCTEKCFHDKLYRVGDVAKFTKAKDGPMNKKGELIHFVQVGEAAVEKRPSEVRVNNKEV